ncbi:gamma-glutamyltransferase family protein [Sphingomonas sabuli]|uniref:Gamma-glutamyltransferase family protein n=1 Tax=Sphingomonas sabuli TaxID=2764186 RepID=A0A7G9KZG0_9SPHN|nr:gamma-glutamyltransferase family protein [Sphingomonas sabuli]QNM81759.1 gamma-glutamyltransferase family protein [Sphingomonas sabuli]
MPLTKTIAALAALSLAGCTALPPQAALPAAPAQTAAAQPFAIAANPLATRAGHDVLARGGSAVDAAVAVQAMLSLVEPQSSGVGGGAFITYYDAATRSVSVYDGREVAPAQATTTMFLGADGKPLPFGEAVLSGRATGVPGAVAALAMAHKDHGRLPWNSLFGDAQRTAAQGFAVSPRLARLMRVDAPENSAPDVKAYFTKPDGTLLDAGDTLRNPAYADFLARLAAQGPAALYSGSTAARIVERTHVAPLPGSMTMADLANYRPIKREALCRPWRALVMCVPPPPSSGVGLIQLMKMLEQTDIASRGPADPQAWFLFAEASRLMYADRDRYVGDSASVPVAGLLAPDYIAARARLIGRAAAPAPAAGNPASAVVAGIDATIEPSGTSHFIVRDSIGNVVSMTTTVESLFGSGRMVDGFFLNNQLTDFSFAPVDAQGRAAVNAVAPGKRPRSSMVPTVLLNPDGSFAGAIGSAGGNAILAYVAKSLVAAVDWKMSMPDALAAPNLVARGTAFGGEVDKFPPQVLQGLAQRGIALKPGQGEDSGLTGVLIRNGRIDGAADPRREGIVLVVEPR